MARAFITKASFERAYDRLHERDRTLVKKALRMLERYLATGQAPLGLGLTKLAPGIYECRVGRALRIVYVEEGSVLALSLLGSHDEVRRFLKRA